MMQFKVLNESFKLVAFTCLYVRSQGNLTFSLQILLIISSEEI